MPKEDHHQNNKVYPYEFGPVLNAYWLKYPNPFSKHVLSEDVLERKLLDNGQLYTKRIITKHFPVPTWVGVLIGGGKYGIGIEESWIDAKKGVAVFVGQNFSFEKFIRGVELSTFYRLPEQNTYCEKVGLISTYNGGVGSILRKMASSRYQKNVSRASQGFDLVINALYNPRNDDAIVKSVRKDKLALLKSYRKLCKDYLRQKAIKPVVPSISKANSQKPNSAIVT